MSSGLLAAFCCRESVEVCNVHFIPWQPRWVALKERQDLLSCQLPALTPFGAVLNNPVSQRPLKSDVLAGLFGLNPFVLQNLFALSLKFPIERRILQQIIS